MQPAQRDGREVGAKLRNLIDAIQDLKNLSQEIWSLQFDCLLSSCPDKYELAKKRLGEKL